MSSNSENLRRKRAGKKSVVTKRINQIAEMIELGENGNLVVLHSDHLKNAFKDVEKAHEEYLGSLDEDDITNSYEWLADVQNMVDSCICSVELFKNYNESDDRKSIISKIGFEKKCNSEPIFSSYEKVQNWRQSSLISDQEYESRLKNDGYSLKSQNLCSDAKNSKTMVYPCLKNSEMENMSNFVAKNYEDRLKSQNICNDANNPTMVYPCQFRWNGYANEFFLSDHFILGIETKVE